MLKSLELELRFIGERFSLNSELIAVMPSTNLWCASDADLGRCNDDQIHLITIKWINFNFY